MAIADQVASLRARRRRVSVEKLQVDLYASLAQHLVAEVASCRTSVDQLDAIQRHKVISAYGEEDAWRWAATDDLQTLVGVMEELTRRAGEALTLETDQIREPVQGDLPLSGGRDGL